MDIVQIEDLSIYFPIYKGFFKRVSGNIKAVDKVSFSIKKGDTLGLVGESGCGKTTIGKALLNIYRPTQGKIEYHFKKEKLLLNRSM